MAHLGGTTAQIQQQIDQNEITAFNNNFYAYTAKECTIYDVLSVVNMAKSFNEQEDYTPANTDYYIDVKIGENSVINSLSIQSIDSKIKDSSDTDYGSTSSTDTYGLLQYELQKYSAEVETSTLTGRIKLVKFKTK